MDFTNIGATLQPMAAINTKPGVIVIEHDDTGLFFIAVFGNCRRRLNTWLWRMRHDERGANPQLLQAYETSQALSLHVIQCDTVQQAAAVGDHLLQAHGLDPNCTNYNSKTGYAPTSFNRKSPAYDSTRRPVSINGVRYASIQAAATALNVKYRTVHGRLMSTSEKFKSWKYAKKAKLLAYHI